MKRFHTFFEDFHEVVCTKVRKGAERLVTLKEGEPQGKHVVIVDDLVQSGGTLASAGRFSSRTAPRRSARFARTGVFPNDKHERFTKSDMFENFWITDSCPQTVARVEGKKPFKILSLAGRIAQALEF